MLGLLEVDSGGKPQQCSATQIGPLYLLAVSRNERLVTESEAPNASERSFCVSELAQNFGGFFAGDPSTGSTSVRQMSRARSAKSPGPQQFLHSLFVSGG